MTKRPFKEAETTRTEKVKGSVLDAETRIILLENVQNHRRTRIKEHSSEVLGVIAGKKMMKRIKMKCVSWLKHQMRYALESTWNLGLREMEQGFLNKSSKSKNKKKDIGDSNQKTTPLLSELAKKVWNIEGKILGKDGKPMQPYRNVNVVESPMVVETLDATRADDGGVVIDVVAGNMNRPNVAEPAFSIGKNGHGVTSVNKEDEGTVKTMISGTLNTSSVEGTMRDMNSLMNKLEK
ncbi:hypothetical protein Tco_1094771 [Tanacetum coccineum]|uniref:Uncharacterized protein n=1 Tax=Tanacetum coccineum TaxID=301880 RepID=A0ABQ5IGN8_9ASTR